MWEGMLPESSSIPPPSLTRAATMQIQSTAKGDRSCNASYVSVLESKTGRNVEHPWKKLKARKVKSGKMGKTVRGLHSEEFSGLGLGNDIFGDDWGRRYEVDYAGECEKLTIRESSRWLVPNFSSFRRSRLPIRRWGPSTTVRFARLAIFLLFVLRQCVR